MKWTIIFQEKTDPFYTGWSWRKTGHVEGNQDELYLKRADFILTFKKRLQNVR